MKPHTRTAQTTAVRARCLPRKAIVQGRLSATSYVQASLKHECECGNPMEITMQWPEGLTSSGRLNITGVQCPACGAPVVLPAARYWVEDFQLLSVPLDSASP